MANCFSFNGFVPVVHESSFIHPNATVTGNVTIGADVYIDTVLIARVLEALHPTPVCIPASQAGLVSVIETWAGRQLMFQVLLPTFAALMPHLPPEFLLDRAAMSPSLSPEAIVDGAPQGAIPIIVGVEHQNARVATLGQRDSRRRPLGGGHQ